MLLIELAVQNVKGFSPSSRAALRPGYNVFVPLAGTAPGLVPVLAALFYSDGSSADAALATGPLARAGLTAQGTDGRVYRLVRGLGGTATLHRLEPTKQWAVVAKDNAEIGRLLRSALGVPSREAFDSLFSFTPQSLPSRCRGEKTPATPGGEAAVAPSRDTRQGLRSTALVEAAMAASKSGGAKPQAEALRAEVEQGKALEEQQFKLEGLLQRVFALDQLVKRLDGLAQKVESLKQGLQGMHSLESVGLDDQAIERAARYDEAHKKLHEQLGKLGQEESFAIGMPGESPQVAPLWKDRAFLAGVGVGVVAMGIGIATRALGAGAVALASIPAFGYAGLSALRWIGQLQRVDAIERRHSVYQDREQKLRAAFDVDFLLIKGAMKVIDVDSGKELIEYFARFKEQSAKLVAAERELAEAQGSTELAAARAELEDLQKQTKDLEASIAEAGAGVMRDWREAERELAQMEGVSAGAFVAVGGSLAPPAKDDPTPKLLAAAQPLFAGASLESLKASLRDRVSQYIVALTDRRYTGVDIDARGAAQLLAPGRPVPAGQLEDLDLDLLYIAVKLTIVERYAPLGKPVLVMDEPFLGFDDAKLALISRMLKHIGAHTQVLHATALPAHHGVADAAHSA